MDARFNGIATRFAKRPAKAALVVPESPLLKSTRPLVGPLPQPDRRLARVNRGREAERAALALAEEGGWRAPRGISDETWAQVRKYCNDDQIAAVVWGIALFNAATRLAVIMDQRGGSYQAGMFIATADR